MKKIVSRIELIVALPAAVLVIGTVGFMLLENMGFLDAVYLTIVTISTVGYGDFHPTTIGGKLFGILLIIIGIGTFLTIITRLTQNLIQRRQEQLRRQRLNMIIGVFFTEVGNDLLEMLAGFDPDIEEIRSEFTIDQGWTDNDYARLRRRLRHHKFRIDHEKLDLEAVLEFLTKRGEILLRQIENPDLFEHGAFTELLWASVHLRDELVARKSLKGLPDTDITHLAVDVERVYSHLVTQWLSYLVHLKRNFPYLHSLAVRTNPFVEDASPVVE